MMNKEIIKVKPLHIMLSKMSGYVKKFGKTKCMSFLMKND